MLVEFLGLPASGKTTLTAGVQKALLAAGLNVCLDRALETQDRTLPGFISRNPLPRAIFRLEQFRRCYPDCADVMDQIGITNITAKTLLLSTGAKHQILINNPGLYDVVLADEGFLHRAIYLIAGMDADQDRLLAAFCQAVPLPKVIVYLSLPAEQSFARAVERLAARDKSGQNRRQIERRIERAHGDVQALANRVALMEQAVGALGQRGSLILKVPTDVTPSDALLRTTTELMELLS